MFNRLFHVHIISRSYSDKFTIINIWYFNIYALYWSVLETADTFNIQKPG